jgi:hypothetical protein
MGAARQSLVEQAMGRAGTSRRRDAAGGPVGTGQTRRIGRTG